MATLFAAQVEPTGFARIDSCTSAAARATLRRRTSPNLGSGLFNTLRVDTADKYQWLIATSPPRPVIDRDLFRAIQVEQNHTEALMVRADFPTVFNARGNATSVVLQGAFFSPLPQSGASRWTFDRQLELGDFIPRARASGLEFFANVGMSSHAAFMSGNLGFNLEFAQEIREWEPPFALRSLIRQWSWLVGGTNRVRLISADHFPVPVPVPGVVVTLPHPEFVFDPTHPDVVRLCMAHVRDFVRRHPCKGFFLRGENHPVWTFAPHNLAGFQRYMEEILGVGNAGLLQGRWLLPAPIARFQDIDVRGPHWNSRVEGDYRLFMHTMVRELGVLHYTTARLAVPGWYSILGFSLGGMERSALDSDSLRAGSTWRTRGRTTMAARRMPWPPTRMQLA